MESTVKFKKMVFKSPSPRISLVVIAVLGFVSALISVRWIFSDLQMDFLKTSVLSFFFFAASPAIYGLATNYIFDKFYGRRAFLLALINQVLLLSGVLTIQYSTDIIFFTLSFAYTINILSLAGVNNDKGFISLLYPLFYFSPIFAFLHFTGVFVLSFVLVAVFFLVGIASLLSVHVVEYFFRLNLETSPLELINSFINNEPISLKSGTEISSMVQALKIRTDRGDYTISLPWLHPGPSGTVGGGTMSKSLINNLSGSGDENAKGYFWHVPSSHEEDPCNPEVNRRILDSVLSKEPVYDEKATKIFKRSNDSFEIYGQKIGESFIVFLNVEGVDDYEMSIFRKIIDETGKRIAFVDMHHHKPTDENKMLMEGEEVSENLVREIIDLLNDLEEKEAFNLRAGMEVSQDGDLMALVEEIDDSKYLFVTLNKNGIPVCFEDKLEEIDRDERFDHTILLTTDTHESLDFLDDACGADLPFSSVIDTAFNNTSEAKVGLLEDKLDGVKVLGKKSYIFESSVTFAVHLFPILILLIYFFVLMFLVI